MRIVVPLSPGGFTDVAARILRRGSRPQLGQQFVVENKPGAGGTIGADFVAKAQPDGYTLLLTGTPHVISAHLYKKLPYDALKDFTPVALLASGPYVLVVNPQQLPVSSVRELIALAKAQPGKIDYASSGNGSAQHLVGALFNSMAGIELNHVPYKGSGPAMQDLLGGQVKVSFAGVPERAAARQGRQAARARASRTPKRWRELPDVPTVAEAGVPGYEATLWLGLLAPAGHAARDRAAAERRDRQGAAGPGVAAELPRRRRRRDRHGSAGARRLHPRRVREVGPRGARHRRDRQLSSSRHCLLFAWRLSPGGRAGLAQRRAEPQPIPTFAELEAAGARIGEIRIVAQRHLRPRGPRENNLLYRVANKLHINTRPEVIRQRAAVPDRRAGLGAA